MPLLQDVRRQQDQACDPQGGFFHHLGHPHPHSPQVSKVHRLPNPRSSIFRSKHAIQPQLRPSRLYYSNNSSSQTPTLSKHLSLRLHRRLTSVASRSPSSSSANFGGLGCLGLSGGELAYKCQGMTSNSLDYPSPPPQYSTLLARSDNTVSVAWINCQRSKHVQATQHSRLFSFSPCAFATSGCSGPAYFPGPQILGRMPSPGAS